MIYVCSNIYACVCVHAHFHSARTHTRKHTHTRTHKHAHAQTGATGAVANAHGNGGTPVRIALKPAERVTFRVDSSLLLRTLALDWTHCSVCCLLAHTRRARRHAVSSTLHNKGLVDLGSSFFFQKTGFEPCLFILGLFGNGQNNRILIINT